MGLDLNALRAKLAAQKAAAGSVENTTAFKTSTNTNNGVTNEAPDSSVQTSNLPVSNPSTGNSQVSSDNGTPAPTVNAPEKLGTSKTSEIDHLDFISKMNSLAEAIHKQHPTMPVLLRQIHTQLRNDPELVTTLDDDAIGIIVRGLQVQTKTELVAEAVKKTSSGRAKKNAALDTSMF